MENADDRLSVKRKWKNKNKVHTQERLEGNTDNVDNDWIWWQTVGNFSSYSPIQMFFGGHELFV